MMPRAWTRSLTRICVLALLLSVAGPALAQDVHVIKAGHEAAIQALFAPHRLGDTLAGGYTFQGIEIAREEIRVGVHGEHADSFFSLRHASTGGERVGAFAVTFDVRDPAARPALDELLAAVRGHEEADIWDTISAPALAAPQGIGNSPSQATSTASAAPLAIAHGLYLLAAIFGLAVWVGRRRKRLVLVGAVLAAILAWTTAFLLRTSPEDIPIQALSGLQEGTTLMVLNLLGGHGAHGGVNLEFLESLWIHASVPLRTRVWVSAWLTGVDVLLFAGIAQALLARFRLTALAVAAFATAPTTFLAATSESPAAWLALYFFLGVSVAAGLQRASKATPRRLLTLGLVPGAFLLAETRVEWLALGATSLAAATTYEPRIRRYADALVAAIIRLSKRLAQEPRAWMGLLILLSVGPLVIHWLPESHQLRDLVGGLGYGAWDLPHFMTLFAGIGPSLLISCGLVYGIYRWRQTLLLPLSVVVMFAAYEVTGHGGHAHFEMLRYLTMLMPPCFVLMLLGWQGLERFATSRQWPKWWSWCAVALLIPATLATRHLENFTGSLPGVQQAELRYVAQALEDHPDCAFLTPVTSAEAVGGPHGVTQQQWALFGRGRSVVTVPQDGSPAAEVLRRLAPDARCHLLYHSATCSLVGAPACPPLGSPETHIDERSLRNHRYYVHVDYRDPVELFLVRLAGEDAAPSSAEEPVEEEGGNADGHP